MKIEMLVSEQEHALIEKMRAADFSHVITVTGKLDESQLLRQSTAMLDALADTPVSKDGESIETMHYVITR